jgi:hypothetical protein
MVSGVDPVIAQEADDTLVPKRNRESSPCVSQATGGPMRHTGPNARYGAKAAELREQARSATEEARGDVRADRGST